MEKKKSAGDAGRSLNFRQIIASNDLLWMGLLAAGWLALLTVIGLTGSWTYGFHRDELNFIYNAMNLDWGYVEYPPLTPFIARGIIAVFGVSPIALKFTAALVMAIAVWLTGVMARSLGGGRPAQALAMACTAAAPLGITNTRFFSYQTFDLLWWVLAAYLIIKLVQTNDPRWWLAVGAVLGLGVMTKYSIPFLVAGIAAGVILTPLRSHLKSPWLWAGAVLAGVIFLPNIIWMAQNNWITLEFQSVTRARNMEMGRTDNFLLQQLYSCTNPATVPLWLGALYVLFLKPEGKPYRILGWIYLVTLLLFLDAHGRFYYMAGAYPMLFAVGASLWMRFPAEKGLSLRQIWNRLDTGSRIFYPSLVILGLFFTFTLLPFTPVDSAWWRFDSDLNPEIREEIGWPEQVKEVARIYNALPETEKSQTAVFGGNYGEAGALYLYGPGFNLPAPISGINTFWLKGYGNPPPETLIIVGANKEDVERAFSDCVLSGHTPNPHDISNEETRDHPDIFTCKNLRFTWPDFWKKAQGFG
jgi:hypothetical protein